MDNSEIPKQRLTGRVWCDFSPVRIRNFAVQNLYLRTISSASCFAAYISCAQRSGSAAFRDSVMPLSAFKRSRMRATSARASASILASSTASVPLVSREV